MQTHNQAIIVYCVSIKIGKGRLQQNLINQCEIIILNLYISNKITSNYVDQKLIELQRETDKSTITMIHSLIKQIKSKMANLNNSLT